ncbi:MAG: mitochondrial fission ELM1 family protein [Defluviicoccus sp.]
MAPLAWITESPRVWVLMGHKAGDNNQVLSLAEALGWPFEIKRFVYNRFEPLAHALFGATLAGVDATRSSPLVAPWPDLVLTAGRRNEPVARWIKQQARPHAVRVVHVGRPWSNLDHFDLVVTTPQYRLPDRPNVLHNKTPLHRVTAERLSADAALWAPRLRALPQAMIAVVIGGPSGPYSFDRAAGRRLAVQASALARSCGGSLLVTTSARTPAQAIDAFAEAVDVPHYLFRWSKDAKENPYFGFLGLAHSIIVTGDSMSMLTEACATRKPVYIFDLGEGRNAMRLDAPSQPFRWRAVEATHVKAFLYRQVLQFGPVRLGRDIRIIHRDLIEAKRAVWLGERFPEGPLPPLECLERAVAGVRALFQLPPLTVPAELMEWRELLPARRSA